MILISHRGNINSINPQRENTHEYIDEAIDSGYHVEIDLFCHDDKLWLGHDEPNVTVDSWWLTERTNRLFIHAKNHMALEYILYNTEIPVFYHTVESHVLIGNTALIWSHELSEATSNSIIPLLNEEDFKRKHEFKNVYGICSDFVGGVE